MLVAVVIGGGVAVFVPWFGGGDRTRVVALDDPAPAPTRGAVGGGNVANSAAVVAGPAGSVVGEDGKPVAEAEVILGLPGRFIDISVPQGRLNAAVRTDAQGRFAFGPGPAWSDLFVRAPGGFAGVRSERMPADGRIVLQGWGRVEGTLRVGNRPAAGQAISLSVGPKPHYVPTTNPQSPAITRSGASVSFRQTARTDAEGRFVFTQVVPGAAVLARETTTPESRSRVRRLHPAALVSVAPGQTARVDVGGSGRPVVGKVALGSPDERLALTGTITLGGDPRFRSGLRVPADWATLTEQQRVAIIDAWQDTQLQAALEVPVTVAADGTFRAEDVPAGAHTLSVWADSDPPAGGGRIERLAEGSMIVSVPEIPGGRNDEAFDAGSVTVRLRPAIKIGQAAPPVEASAANGRPVRLADFKGRYVLLTFLDAYGASASASDARFASAGTLRDRGGDRVALLGVVLADPARTDPGRLPDVPGWTSATHREWRTKLDPGYANSPGSYLIDPDGKVLAKSGPADRGLYAMLDRALGPMREAAAGVVVDSESAPATSASRGFELKRLPAIAKDDLGRRATFGVVDGRKADFGGELGTLNDGLGPRHDRDEALMWTFAPGTVEGRIRADLGAVAEVEGVRTYAWYKDGHRWAQVYRLYGSDGAAAGFDPEPKFGTDPAARGWTFIASVDTREAAGGQGLGDDQRGQSAVAVGAKSGALGKYRYLLFVTFATETHNPWGQTFWSEIDVVGR